jgi:hypothetical protein
MADFATFIVQSNSDEEIESDKIKIEELKKQNKDIKTVRMIKRDPEVDKVITESGSGLDFKGTKANIMVEVKLDKDTDLNKIEGNLKTIGKNVTIIY